MNSHSVISVQPIVDKDNATVPSDDCVVSSSQLVSPAPSTASRPSPSRSEESSAQPSPERSVSAPSTAGHSPVRSDGAEVSSDVDTGSDDETSRRLQAVLEASEEEDSEEEEEEEEDSAWDESRPSPWLSQYYKAEVEQMIHEDSTTRNTPQAVHEESGGPEDDENDSADDSAWDGSHHLSSWLVQYYKAEAEQMIHEDRSSRNTLPTSPYRIDSITSTMQQITCAPEAVMEQLRRRTTMPDSPEHSEEDEDDSTWDESRPSLWLRQYYKAEAEQMIYEDSRDGTSTQLQAEREESDPEDDENDSENDSAWGECHHLSSCLIQYYKTEALEANI